jgi:hypothetical protein
MAGPFTGLPRAGGKSPYIDPEDILRLLTVGDSAADHPWSALRVVKSYRKDCLTAKVLLEAKSAAPHPKTVLELTI